MAYRERQVDTSSTMLRCGDLVFPIPQITSEVTTLDTRFQIFIILLYVHIFALKITILDKEKR